MYKKKNIFKAIDCILYTTYCGSYLGNKTKMVLICPSCYVESG